MSPSRVAIVASLYLCTTLEKVSKGGGVGGRGGVGAVYWLVGDTRKEVGSGLRRACIKASHSPSGMMRCSW